LAIISLSAQQAQDRILKDYTQRALNGKRD